MKKLILFSLLFIGLSLNAQKRIRFNNFTSFESMEVHKIGSKDSSGTYPNYEGSVTVSPYYVHVDLFNSYIMSPAGANATKFPFSYLQNVGVPGFDSWLRNTSSSTSDGPYSQTDAYNLGDASNQVLDYVIISINNGTPTLYRAGTFNPVSGLTLTIVIDTTNTSTITLTE